MKCKFYKCRTLAKSHKRVRSKKIKINNKKNYNKKTYNSNSHHLANRRKST